MLLLSVGQIELYMASDHVRNIIEMLKRNTMFESEVTVVELFDATYCYEYSNYISLTLQALVSFVNLEMPHVNVRFVLPVLRD